MTNSEIDKICRYLTNVGFVCGGDKRRSKIICAKPNWFVNIYLKPDSFVNVTIFVTVSSNGVTKIFHKFLGNVQSFKEFRVIFNAAYNIPKDEELDDLPSEVYSYKSR